MKYSRFFSYSGMKDQIIFISGQTTSFGRFQTDSYLDVMQSGLEFFQSFLTRFLKSNDPVLENEYQKTILWFLDFKIFGHFFISRPSLHKEIPILNSFFFILKLNSFLIIFFFSLGACAFCQIPDLPVEPFSASFGTTGRQRLSS